MAKRKGGVAAMSEKTDEEQRPAHLFQPGQSGNPAGRPKGSRNKLGEAFISALHADFQQHGEAAIVKVRDERPHEYLKVVASLLPKQLEIKESPFDELSDDELAALIATARSAISVARKGGAGVTDEAGPEPARKLSPLH